MEGYLFGVSMEIFDLYNNKNQKINKEIYRGQPTEEGEYHKIVQLWIRNSKNQYLIQQRNKASDTYPYQWAPTAGCVKKGETSMMAVLRESREELSLSINSQELIFKDSIIVEDDFANHIIDVYLLEKDIDLDQIMIDPIEVKDVMYASKDLIEQMIKDFQFWNYKTVHENYFDILERR